MEWLNLNAFYLFRLIKYKDESRYVIIKNEINHVFPYYGFTYSECPCCFYNEDIKQCICRIRHPLWEMKIIGFENENGVWYCKDCTYYIVLPAQMGICPSLITRLRIHKRYHCNRLKKNQDMCFNMKK